MPSPPPYKRQIWDYAKADKDEIRQFLTNTDWISKFRDLSTNEMVPQFTSTVLEIMSRFIPNKMIICNDKDPLCITPSIKTAIKRKHRVSNKFAKLGHKPDEWEPVRIIQNETSRMITDAKENYFSTLERKLPNPALGLKTYWTTLNRIINKKETTNCWKMKYLSPISRRKLIFSTIFFVQRCLLNLNDSVLSNPFPRCNHHLENINIDTENNSITGL